MSGKTIRETLAALGVIASMVFVGLEIRQNTAAQRSQTRQAIADAAQEWNLRVAENAGLSRAFNAVIWEGDEVSPGDSGQAYGAMFALLRQVENVYLQYEEGVFDERILTSYGFSGGIFARPAFVAYWNDFGLRELFDPRFLEAFEAANDLR